MEKFTVLSAAEQVAAHLRMELLRGGLSRTMPGVNPLAAELGVNHKTLKAALPMLISGVLYYLNFWLTFGVPRASLGVTHRKNHGESGSSGRVGIMTLIRPVEVAEVGSMYEPIDAQGTVPPPSVSAGTGPVSAKAPPGQVQRTSGRPRVEPRKFEIFFDPFS